jgi:hypothetical protein
MRDGKSKQTEKEEAEISPAGKFELDYLGNTQANRLMCLTIVRKFQPLAVSMRQLCGHLRQAQAA